MSARPGSDRERQRIVRIEKLAPTGEGIVRTRGRRRIRGSRAAGRARRDNCLSGEEEVLAGKPLRRAGALAGPGRRSARGLRRLRLGAFRAGGGPSRQAGRSSSRPCSGCRESIPPLFGELPVEASPAGLPPAHPPARGPGASWGTSPAAATVSSRPETARRSRPRRALSCRGSRRPSRSRGGEVTEVALLENIPGDRRLLRASLSGVPRDAAELAAALASDFQGVTVRGLEGAVLVARGEARLTLSVEGRAFRVSVDTFFQGNRHLVGPLSAAVREAARRAPPGDALDAFGGAASSPERCSTPGIGRRRSRRTPARPMTRPGRSRPGRIASGARRWPPTSRRSSDRTTGASPASWRTRPGRGSGPICRASSPAGRSTCSSTFRAIRPRWGATSPSILAEGFLDPGSPALRPFRPDPSRGGAGRARARGVIRPVLAGGRAPAAKAAAWVVCGIFLGAWSDGGAAAAGCLLGVSAVGLGALDGARPRSGLPPRVRVVLVFRGVCLRRRADRRAFARGHPYVRRRARVEDGGRRSRGASDGLLERPSSPGAHDARGRSPVDAGGGLLAAVPGRGHGLRVGGDGGRRRGEPRGPRPIDRPARTGGPARVRAGARAPVAEVPTLGQERADGRPAGHDASHASDLAQPSALFGAARGAGRRGLRARRPRAPGRAAPRPHLGARPRDGGSVPARRSVPSPRRLRVARRARGRPRAGASRARGSRGQAARPRAASLRAFSSSSSEERIHRPFARVSSSGRSSPRGFSSGRSARRRRSGFPRSFCFSAPRPRSSRSARCSRSRRSAGSGLFSEPIRARLPSRPEWLWSGFAAALAAECATAPILFWRFNIVAAGAWLTAPLSVPLSAALIALGGALLVCHACGLAAWPLATLFGRGSRLLEWLAERAAGVAFLRPTPALAAVLAVGALLVAAALARPLLRRWAAAGAAAAFLAMAVRSGPAGPRPRLFDRGPRRRAGRRDTPAVEEEGDPRRWRRSVRSRGHGVRPHAGAAEAPRPGRHAPGRACCSRTRTPTTRSASSRSSKNCRSASSGFRRERTKGGSPRGLRRLAAERGVRVRLLAAGERIMLEGANVTVLHSGGQRRKTDAINNQSAVAPRRTGRPPGAPHGRHRRSDRDGSRRLGSAPARRRAQGRAPRQPDLDDSGRFSRPRARAWPFCPAGGAIASGTPPPSLSRRSRDSAVVLLRTDERSDALRRAPADAHPARLAGTGAAMTSDPRPLLLVVVGPTGSGKTDLAHEVARSRGGEIVSADAFAVYRGLDAGTAKPTPAQRAEVRYHMIDVAEPGGALLGGALRERSPLDRRRDRPARAAADRLRRQRLLRLGAPRRPASGAGAGRRSPAGPRRLGRVAGAGGRAPFSPLERSGLGGAHPGRQPQVHPARAGDPADDRRARFGAHGPRRRLGRSLSGAKAGAASDARATPC